MLRMKTFFLYVVFGYILIAYIFCNNTIKNSDKGKKVYKCYTTDKRIISYTIKEWVKNDQKWFLKEEFFQDTINLSEANFQIDTIIYSNDKSKFFAIVLFNADTNLLSEDTRRDFDFKEKYYYGGRSILGYRGQSTLSWEVRFFWQFIGTIYPSRNEAQEDMRNVYFNELRNPERAISTRDINNKPVTIPIKYSVLDEGFWSSDLWDSLSFKRGYFPFELNNLGEVIPQIHVVIPDSLVCK